MKRFLTTAARRMWPDFDTMTEPDRLALLREIFGTLFGLPFVAVALVWLAAVTDLELLRTWWAVLLLILGLSILAGRLSFFQITAGRDGGYNYNGSSLEIVIVMSAMLLFGPTAVWIPFWGRLIDFMIDRPRKPASYQKWNGFRNLAFNLGPSINALLLFLWLYQWLGGQFPLADLRPATSWPAFVALLVWLPLEGLFIICYSVLLTILQLIPRISRKEQTGFGKRMFGFFLLANAPAFFGILAAVTFVQQGVLAYLFLTGGVLLTSFLARRLSQQAMLSQQRSREVSQLEKLGRAILAAPVDASTLPQLLKEYVPQMFAYHLVEIRLLSGETLLHLPTERPNLKQEMWDWLQMNPQPHHFAPGEITPWSNENSSFPIYLNPILSTERSELLGGIGLIMDRLYFEESILDLGPALQVLAAQIATALHQAEIQAQTLAHQKTVQELEFAWQIQESFLPNKLPEIRGWQLAARLIPCQETSGDFYDVLELPNGRLAVLIADVADKGMGAALFMAVCRTLMRTYAFEYQEQPELVLQATNDRILTDTRNNMFVTVFFGILDPHSGRLTYANAGHNPPYLFRAGSGEFVLDMIKEQGLRNTGIPLGIIAGVTWEAKATTLEHGDTLIMYTDGITEAQNTESEFFEDYGLLAAVQGSVGGSALQIQAAVLTAVDQFSAAAAQCDDETVVVIKRNLRGKKLSEL